MIDFSALSEVHRLCGEAMVGWSLRYVEADGSWEFSIVSMAPSEDWSYDGSFELGVAAMLKHLHQLSEKTLHKFLGA